MRPRLPETSAVMSPMRAAGSYLGDGLGAGEDAFDERGLAAALRPAEQLVMDIGGWYKAHGDSLCARERAAADDLPRPGGRRQRPLNGYAKIEAMLKGNAGGER